MEDRRELYDQWCQLSRKVEGMKFMFQNELDSLTLEDARDFMEMMTNINRELQELEIKSLEALTNARE